MGYRQYGNAACCLLRTVLSYLHHVERGQVFVIPCIGWDDVMQGRGMIRYILFGKMFTDNGDRRGDICTGRSTVSPSNSLTDICFTHC